MADRATELMWLMRNHSIEDGMGHPADALIAHSLPLYADHWLVKTYIDLTWLATSRAADLMQLLAHHDIDAVGPYGITLARQSLTHEALVVRDQAALALNHWGGPEALRVLQEHVEPDPWLADCIRQMIDSWE